MGIGEATFRLIDLQAGQSEVHEHRVDLVDALVGKHLEKSSNAACTGVETVGKAFHFLRFVASASASVSRSMPIRRALGLALRNAVECPARPRVQSTAIEPGFANAGATKSTQSRSSTG